MLLFVLSRLLPVLGTQNCSNTYSNPILTKEGADPWVIRHEDYYYMTYSTNDNITLLRNKILTNWDSAESRLLYKPEPNRPDSTDLWAPELHYLEGQWWVIYTADPHYDQPIPELDMLCTFNCPAVNHRMFTLVGDGADPWTANFAFKSELNTYDQFAIDGTYFKHKTGLYHVYSCWDSKFESWPANLCVTKMSSPSQVASPVEARSTISRPTNGWENTPNNRTINVRLATNEGPQQLTNPHTGQEFVIFSGGRSDNRNYCLGQLELIGQDPMNPNCWKKHNEGCVFYQNPEEKAYGVGHASFTKSPDGKEDWIVYHGMRDPTNGWSARTIRTQKFTWNEDGSPKFPRPGYGPYEVPSGQ
ncbi:Arabinanase/levansucrase/invertase [Tothia fuscella]|uniref:Arabinanase/levansucrase/invertase n=1 Tax=Tothia fuscella TaxID=1048955 RepID=A0A9P4U2W2_9PEZI|nr:Arabinanase/levansucrase/invertase [Tothia fuscella]